MKAAHKGMGLKDLEFNAIVELLAATLTELGVDGAVIGDIAALVEPLRKDMVEKWEGEIKNHSLHSILNLMKKKNSQYYLYLFSK